MKKIILLLMATTLSTGLFAQKFKIVSGNLDFLKNEKTIDAEFTYNGTKVGKMTEKDYINKKKAEAEAKENEAGDRWEAAWESDKTQRFQPKFIELFNKRMEEKTLSLVEDGDSNYKLIVNADFIEPGFNVGVMRRNSSVNLTVKFVEKSTGKEVAVITILDSSANDFFGTDFDSGYRIQESFAKAGRELAVFLTKKAKL